MLNVVPCARTRLDSADAAFVGGIHTPIHEAALHRGRAKEFRPVNITMLLPFIVLIGAMVLMTRSAKNTADSLWAIKWSSGFSGTS